MSLTLTQPGGSGALTADSGLRCPRCEYNLTGLTEPRCPECGTPFDWEQVRRAAANPPTLAFERARGWHKVPGFFITWATALFAPWVFARQIVRRVDTRHAVAFGLTCFASTALAVLWGADRETYFLWLPTAVIYIALQTVGLTLLDFPGWKHPGRTLHFWALVSCYTSAIMTTEVVHGPPVVGFSELWDIFFGEPALGWPSDIQRIVWAAQLGLWLLGLACCCFARLRRAPTARWLAAAFAVLVSFGLLNLYAATVEYIGAGWVFRLVDPLF